MAKSNTEKLFGPLAEREKRFSGEIENIAYSIHRALGPGLLESIYERSFCDELEKRKIAFRRQKLWEADPLDSVNPRDPLNPSDPVDLKYSAESLKSLNAADPVDPADPADPVDPTDPVNSVDAEPQKAVMVDNLIIVVIKAQLHFDARWESQMMNTLGACNKRVGYIVNFNVPSMKEGIRRKVFEMDLYQVILYLLTQSL